MSEKLIPDWAVARGRAMRPPLAVDPRRTAVLVIDMQNFFLHSASALPVQNVPQLVEAINEVIAAYREAGSPIVWVQHSFAGASLEAAEEGACDARASLIGQLLPGNEAFDIDTRMARSADDHHVVKKTASAFHPNSGCDLAALLEERDIDTLVITGIVTNGCCETTARDATQHGYKVLFASDATGAMSDEEHRAALLNLALWFAEVRPAEELAALAGQSASAAPA